MDDKHAPYSRTYLRDRHPSGSFDEIFLQFGELITFIESGNYPGLWDFYKKESIKYNIPESVTILIDAGISAIARGDNDKKFNFTIDYEYANMVRTGASLSEMEFLLLSLARQLLQELRTANYNDFLTLSMCFGSSELQAKLQEIRR